MIFMEKLKYQIEDRTISELLGIQNFTNAESAILEIVKNSYDAKANKIKLEFTNESLIISDDGIGMNKIDIETYWMHIGKSDKGYEILDDNNNKRILAGSKGVGRFALARLGGKVEILSKKKGNSSIRWFTDWQESYLSFNDSLSKNGTKITISNLRDSWRKKKVESLIEFLEKTYNDTCMTIEIVYEKEKKEVLKYFQEPTIGLNYLSSINLQYRNGILEIMIYSDEFLKKAEEYCGSINLNKYPEKINIFDEIKNFPEYDLTKKELKQILLEIGKFEALFYFTINPSKEDTDKFLYKHFPLVNPLKNGIILYRNAFSISAYEGKKDWLELGKRARKSPAAASHPTGSWRVRENQLSGYVRIDKKENKFLRDLANRQGLEDNIHYQIFIQIIHEGLKVFERYRQEIIRKINKKNQDYPEQTNSISEKIISLPKIVSNLSKNEISQLVSELKNNKKIEQQYKKNMEEKEKRYRYDVRLLNMLSTIGLKASSIAHEIKNDRNLISNSNDSIIAALKEYDMWEILNSDEKRKRIYKDIPYLLQENKKINKKLLIFVNTMLEEIEKKNFIEKNQNVYLIMKKIKESWERDYAWIEIKLDMDENLRLTISEDIVHVIFDNLILNSIQQNEKKQNLEISVTIDSIDNVIELTYVDNGIGLDRKYLSNPKKILEVHESTRSNGHGLGMWIVNNTIQMSGGEIIDIKGTKGFIITFTIGGKRNEHNNNTIY